MGQSPLIQVSEHVYRLAPDERTDRPVLGVVVGERASLVIDAGNSPAHANLLFNEMTGFGIWKPDYVVLTHWHWDHVFGISAFGAPVFAHEETTRAIREMSGLDWSDEALDRRVEEGLEIEFCRDMFKAEWTDHRDLHLRTPDVSFKDNLVFDLGDVSCHIQHVGGDHSADSCIAFIPEDQVLFLGDCLNEDLHHGPPNYTMKKLVPLIDSIMSFQADHYFWGHSPEAMLRTEMLDFFNTLKLIGEMAEQTGDKRDQLLERVKIELGRSLNDEDIEIADAFLAGFHAG
jgi:glyoxylase-like metal-dependent hydrolase (beta-lactamase superfamily II)